MTVHTQIEEEIFYPAFLATTKDKDMHHEAIIEHNSAKQLISEIEAFDPADDCYVSKVHVLSEMTKHHVKEEEQTDGMFAEAKQSRMDLAALGRFLQTDPLGMGAARLQRPQTLNNFAYVTNDPGNKTDGLGLDDNSQPVCHYV